MLYHSSTMYNLARCVCSQTLAWQIVKLDDNKNKMLIIFNSVKYNTMNLVLKC